MTESDGSMPQPYPEHAEKCLWWQMSGLSCDCGRDLEILDSELDDWVSGLL